MVSPSGDRREVYQQSNWSPAPDPPPPPPPPLSLSLLVRFSVLGNFLHLVITCLRGNKRSKKMSFLSSVLVLVSGRLHTVPSGSLIDATTRGKIIVHWSFNRTWKKQARDELSESTLETRPRTIHSHLLSRSTVVFCYNYRSLTLYIHISFNFINFHPK